MRGSEGVAAQEIALGSWKPRAEHTPSNGLKLRVAKEALPFVVSIWERSPQCEGLRAEFLSSGKGK